MLQTVIILLVATIYITFFMKLKIEVIIGEEAYIEITIFRYFKVKKIKLNEKEIEKLEERGKGIAKEEVDNYIKDIKFSDARLLAINVKRFLSKVKYDKLDFSLNVNVDDYILNAYIVTFLNAAIAMVISKNVDRINMKNLNYVITSNGKKTKLNLKCIMFGKIANIMNVIVRIIYYGFKLKKRGNDKHGERTSNREFNGNSNVVTRDNG